MENSSLAIVLSVFSSIVALSGAFISIYKASTEKKKIEADGAASIADGAESLAKGAESLGKAAEISTAQLLKRIVEMEVREVKREQELLKMKGELEAVTAQLVEWKDYAFRLAHQVKSLGHEPIPFKAITHPSL